MNWNIRTVRARLVIMVGTLLIAAIPVDVMAYVDPGTTGMISQMLYVLFYGALGLFFYFLRQIKQHLSRLKESVAKLFGRHS